MGTYLSKPRVMMHFFTYRLLSKGHQTEKCLEGGKIFPKPMAKRTKSTSSSKVLHKLVPRRRRNSMLFYSSWWGLIDIKISQKTPTPGIDDSLFKSIVMRTPTFIPMTRTVSEFYKEKKKDTILNYLKPFISAYFSPNTTDFNVRDKYK